VVCSSLFASKKMFHDIHFCGYKDQETSILSKTPCDIYLIPLLRYHAFILNREIEPCTAGGLTGDGLRCIYYGKYLWVLP